MTNLNRYARFYKCDLQMQTPQDPHWRDDRTSIKPDDLPFDSSHDSDEKKYRISRIARKYLLKCHAAGLEVIGITDHNFAFTGDLERTPSNFAFLRWLRAENERVAKKIKRKPLIILPGFEIEADIGKGCHVLCLFPPETPLSVVDHRLTDCGLPPERRFEGKQPKPSVKRLPDILKVVQNTKDYPGIVIAPHSFDKKGVLNDENIERWLQQEEFQNPDLLCIEIPKPVDQLPQGLRKLIEGGDDCKPEWKRERPIAYVMSSDCYRMDADPAQPGNHIGYRYTWIKMSHPSIESLRQAFLDRDACIRLSPASPELQYTYSKVKRITIRNTAFIREMDVDWSPNLNCLIGSRGTGKSMMINYLRLALDRLRPDDLPENICADIQERNTDTLHPSALIEIILETAGGIYRVVSNGSSRQIYEGSALTPNPNIDIRSLFPCRILSQREIDAIVDQHDKSALLKLLDDFVREQLNELEREAHEHKTRLGQIDIELKQKLENQQHRLALETERTDLDAQLKKQDQLREFLPNWQPIEAEKSFFGELFAEISNIDETWRKYLSDLVLKFPKAAESLTQTVNSTLVKKTAAEAERMVDRLKVKIVEALDEFKQVAIGETSELQALYRKQWLPIFDSAQKRFIELTAGQNSGLLDISSRLVVLRIELQKLDEEKLEIERLESARKEMLDLLHACWQKQTNTRMEKAKELMDRLRPRPDSKPYVLIQIEPQGSKEHLAKLMVEKIPDKRSVDDENLGDFIDEVTRIPVKQPLPQRVFAEIRKGETSEVLLKVLPRRYDKFLEIFTESVLRQLEMERIPDHITYHVYRQDGTLAGPIEKVSAGQQGTAILNLLLAAGTEPLIVDTPEEGLDSEGVYAELVPMFRREKEKRQIIIVTHNANIPVNGAAEQIIALDAVGYLPDEALEQIVTNYRLNPEQKEHLARLICQKDWEKAVQDYLGKQGGAPKDVEKTLSQIGEKRQAEGTLKQVKLESNSSDIAVGALDTPSVKNAVQNIMEGSKEAFHRRREKYGY